jgi:hypothetical protein
VPHVLYALLACHRLLHTLAGAGVGPRPLAATGQTLAVPGAAIALNVSQTANILADFAAELAFNRVFVVQQRVQTLNVVVRQFASPALRIDIQRPSDFDRPMQADPMQVLQGDERGLVVGNVHTQNTRHQSTS